jgi:hypothetical protein
MVNIFPDKLKKRLYKMKHLKKFNESFEKPGPNKGSKKLKISEEDTNLFTDEPVLQKLMVDKKVALIGNEVYYNDTDIEETLKQYLDVKDINESVIESEDIEGFLTNKVSVDLFLDDLIYGSSVIILLKSGKVLEKSQNSKSWEIYKSNEEFEKSTGASLDREYSGSESKELLSLFMSVDDYINESIEKVYIQDQFDNTILNSILDKFYTQNRTI